MEEIWKDIEGHYGFQVSNLGRVKNKNSNKILRLNKQPKSEKPNDYYLLVWIGKSCRVHRLVAQAFVPNPNNLKEVNHLDRVKYNNVYTNLEWSDTREQTSHRFLTSVKTSKYAGVSWCKFQKKWKAQIQVRNKKIQLGFHDNEESARDAYLSALDRFGLKNKYATFKLNLP